MRQLFLGSAAMTSNTISPPQQGLSFQPKVNSCTRSMLQRPPVSPQQPSCSNTLLSSFRSSTEITSFHHIHFLLLSHFSTFHPTACIPGTRTSRRPSPAIPIAQDYHGPLTPNVVSLPRSFSPLPPFSFTKTIRQRRSRQCQEK